MDKMTQGSGIDDALRELAKKRDELLRKLPPLPPARQAVLNASLIEEFPVEAVLRDAATKRDQLLDLPPSGIPVSAESALHMELVGAGPVRVAPCAWRASDSGSSAPLWLRFFRWPTGAVLTACVMTAAAILCFDRRETPSHSNARNLPDVPPGERLNIDARVRLECSPIGRAELFARQAAIAQFNLSTSEPASLQASFLTNRGVYLADGDQAALGIRLDLPAKLTLLEDDLARIP